MLDEKNAEAILHKLDIVVQLLASLIADKHETLETKAMALNRAGITPTEIATICGTTGNTVRVALTKARKKGGQKPKKKAPPKKS